MSHELKPCPNPACTNWNPIGRKRCFKCGQDLQVAPAVSDDPAGHSRLRGSLIMLAAVALLILGYIGARWNEVRSDAVKPILSISEPYSARGGDAERPRVAHSNQDHVTIEGTVDDEHPDSVSAGDVTAKVEEGKFSLRLPVAEAAQQVTLVARDRKGNESNPVTLEVKKDTTPPEFADLRPPEGAMSVQKKLVVEGEANEPLGAVTIGTSVGEARGETFTVNVDLQAGANALSVLIRDLAGNEAKRTLNVSYQSVNLPAGLQQDGNAFVSEIDGSRMVIIPDATFTMGTTQGEPDERPEHSVKVSAFLMDVTPITNEQYAKFMKATGHPAPPPPDFDRNYMASQPAGPVVNVTYTDAQAYADWAKRRLPTEAEWELAARGTDGRLYPWGNEVPTGAAMLANIDGAADGHAAVAPIGTYPKGASPFGLLDMAGNVWQWVVDPYDPSFYASPQSGDNPSGPDQGELFVLRGGAFTSKPADVRSTNRNSKRPDERQRNSGFRTAASLE